jgi:hypothetical protein
METSDDNGTLFLHNLVEFINVQALWFVIRFGCKRNVHEGRDANSDVRRRTRRNIVVRFDGDVVGEFGVIDVFENRKPLTDRRNTNLLERVDVEDNENIASDVVL